MPITTFEGRMGAGKSLASTTMAYIEYTKREILRTAIDYVLTDKTWDKALDAIVQQYRVGAKFAEAQLNEALRIFQEEGEEAYRPEKKIISTNHLNFPHQHFDRQYFVDHLEDEELEDCILLLDESYLFIDSRRTSAKDNLLFQYFTAQTRKRNVDLYLCLLHRDMIDKRIRRWINVRGTCRFNKGPMDDHLPISKRRYNWVTVTFTNIDSGSERRWRFYGPAFWYLYDTDERVAFTRRQKEISID